MCLWSRHVDISPGDRAAGCGGMMEPVSVLKKNGKDRVLHRCLSCGFEHENRISDEDNRDTVIGIMKSVSDNIFKR
jgi:uncharacterized Zn finger protein